jgi:hypothetical protein
MRVSSPVNPVTSRAQWFSDVDDKRHIRVLFKMSRQKFALMEREFGKYSFLERARR